MMRATRPQRSGPDAPTGPSTILVVEDDRPVLDMATHILRAAGHLVVPASSAEEALEAVAQHPKLDLLFTDVVMSGMDGLTLVGAITERRPIAVLVTTGQRTTEMRAAIEQAGVPFLPKPYTAADLCDAVERGLRPKDLDEAGR
jgi:CheY-like chemotaxis protein